MSKKLACPKCRSVKIKKITGASVGDPLKSSVYEAVLAECLKCGASFIIETQKSGRKRVVTVKQVEPFGGEDGDNDASE